MSDADGNIIPLVEDDQGEGVKDLVDFINEANKQMAEVAHVRHDQMAVPQESIWEALQKIQEAVDAVNRRLTLIFGDYFLHNGHFTNIGTIKGKP